MTSASAQSPTVLDAPGDDGACGCDVVVLGTAGIAYRVTDALRAAGLRPGSLLLPPGASFQRARLQLRHALDGGGAGAGAATVTGWRRAPLIIDIYAEPELAGIEPAFHHELYDDEPGPGPLRLHLSPGARSRPAGRCGICAPLAVNLYSEQLFCPADTRLTLLDATRSPMASAVSIYARALYTLLDAIPALPRAWQQQFPAAMADQAALGSVV